MILDASCHSSFETRCAHVLEFSLWNCNFWRPDWKIVEQILIELQRQAAVELEPDTSCQTVTLAHCVTVSKCQTVTLAHYVTVSMCQTVTLALHRVS